MPTFPRCAALAAVLAALLPAAPAALASGGPQNLLVVVNDESADSLDVAHYYRQKRDIPAACFCHLRLDPGHDIGREAFEEKILRPVLAHIRDNGLEGHVRCIVFTRGLPYRVQWAPRRKTSVTTVAAAGTMDIEAMRSHPYFRATGPFTPSKAMPYLSICLTGYSVEDVKRCIDQGAASDGTFPRGTVYLFDGVGPRARTHERYGRPEAVERLRALGLRCEVRKGHSLEDEQDVLGYWTGFTRVNTRNIRFLPGALADHLTSFGGILFHNKSQMSILDFIRAGATGSYGTVMEPTNIFTRHSQAWVFARYAEGLSLVEAYWAAVQDVQLGVFVGEPLATPFAHRPAVSVRGPGTDRESRGTVTFRVTARPREEGRGLRRLEWWVDGRPHGPALPASLPEGAAATLTVRDRSFTAPFDPDEGVPGLCRALARLLNEDEGLSGEGGVEARVTPEGLELRARTEGASGNGAPFSVRVEGAGGEGSSPSLRVTPAEGALEGGAETEVSAARLMLIVSAAALAEGDTLRIDAGGRSFSATVTARDLSTDKPLVPLLTRLLAGLRGSDVFGTVRAGLGAKGRRGQILLASSRPAEEGNGQKVRISVDRKKGSKLSVFPSGERALEGGRTVRHHARASVAFSLVFGALEDAEVAFDTEALGDGWHRLRLVAVEDGPLRTQGWGFAEIKVSNGGGKLRLVPPRSPDLRKPLTFRARFYGRYPAGLGRMVLLVDGREAAEFDKRKRKVTVEPGSLALGEGRHAFQVLVEPRKDTGRPLVSEPEYLTYRR